MRRTVAAFIATVAGLVILLSFKTAPAKPARPVALAGTTPSSPTSPEASASAPASSGPGSPAASASGPASAAATPTPTPSASVAKKPTPSASSATTKTVTGSAVQVSEGFRVFGTVQVRVTITNGKITALAALDYPNSDGRSSQISSFSIPILRQEVLAAQGTQIDVVSGATYTSNAYAQSVQSALDAAKA
jgi:uncharacterized protein with FMN-binding domain